MTSSPLHGQNLLDQWYANFSQCRVIVERHEIANIPGNFRGLGGVLRAIGPSLAVQSAWPVICVQVRNDEA